MGIFYFKLRKKIIGIRFRSIKITLISGNFKLNPFIVVRRFVVAILSQYDSPVMIYYNQKTKKITYFMLIPNKISLYVELVDYFEFVYFNLL